VPPAPQQNEQSAGNGYGVLDRFSEDNQPQPAQAPPAAQNDSATAEGDGSLVDLGKAEEGEESDNDTVKSINNALRSLFR
jgi:hypothetical protein